jgi:uncharacterized protein YwgA
MTRYQLAKLVEWAGTLRTRKRLQKVVFMLQAAGCPFDDDFGLHHFGPYSSDAAQRTDELTSLGLLKEERIDNPAGQQYNYSLTPEALASLAELEQTEKGQRLAEELAPYEQRAKELLRKDVRELEVAATIVYFRRQRNDWPEAVRRTAEFKNLDSAGEFLHRAEGLARQIVS